MSGLGGIRHVGADAEPRVRRLVVARLLKRYLGSVRRVVHERKDTSRGHIGRGVHPQCRIVGGAIDNLFAPITQ